MSRVELPESLKRNMKLWRQGLISLPPMYIRFHKELAEKVLEELKANGVTVHNTYMASDGWGDGMQVLHAIIEEGERLDKIKWDDGSQGFMVRCPSGGWSGLKMHREVKEDLYIQVTNEKGIPFNVRYVRKGDKYGRNRCLINDDSPMVEFYDARNVEKTDDELGQFTCGRYCLSTLMESEQEYLSGRRGLDLHGGVTDWEVSGENMKEVINWLKSVSIAN